MRTLDRYLLVNATLAFLAILLALTGVVWATQALRQFDLVTAQGQTLWTFLAVTALAIPSFALIVGPLALFGAVAFILYRLNADSEFAALAAAGVSAGRLMRPFLILALAVAILTAALSISAIPASLRTMRNVITAIRADVVVNVLREGAFTTLQDGITLHVRQRAAGGRLEGIFVDDERNPKEEMVYTAESGHVAETEQGTFLILEKGAVERKADNASDAQIVVFDRYAFDLSPLLGSGEVTSYKPRERTIGDLLRPNPADTVARSERGRFLAELHERLVNPLYPLAFMIVAFAIMGQPRTTRQRRIAGVLAAAAIVFAIRLVGYGMTSLVARFTWAVPLVYAVPLLACAVGLLAIFRGSLRRPRPLRPAPTMGSLWP
jgi:lipopolysaccharide export system permease protein